MINNGWFFAFSLRHGRARPGLSTERWDMDELEPDSCYKLLESKFYTCKYFSTSSFFRALVLHVYYLT